MAQIDPVELKNARRDPTGASLALFPVVRLWHFQAHDGADGYGLCILSAVRAGLGATPSVANENTRRLVAVP